MPGPRIRRPVPAGPRSPLCPGGQEGNAGRKPGRKMPRRLRRIQKKRHARLLCEPRRLSPGQDPAVDVGNGAEDRKIRGFAEAAFPCGEKGFVVEKPRTRGKDPDARRSVQGEKRPHHRVVFISRNQRRSTPSEYAADHDVQGVGGVQGQDRSLRPVRAEKAGRRFPEIVKQIPRRRGPGSHAAGMGGDRGKGFLHCASDLVRLGEAGRGVVEIDHPIPSFPRGMILRKGSRRLCSRRRISSLPAPSARTPAVQPSSASSRGRVTLRARTPT